MYYAIDDKKRKTGVIEIPRADAKRYNDDGYGIFYTPNSFNAARRIDCLVRINYWYIDIDKVDKSEAMEEIMNCPAIPSFVVETKSGFHCYWEAIDATIQNFNEIEERLIHHFKADKQVKDIPRLLRVPGYYHHKGEPFLIKKAYSSNKSYTEKLMLFAYKAVPKERKPEYSGEIDLETVDLHKLLKPYEISNGERNGKIFKKGVFLKKLGLNERQVEDCLIWLNANISEPLPLSELKNIIRGYSKWQR
jgi:hypothetical protein